MKLKPQHNAGFSLLEANFAVAISIITLVGCFAANASFLSVLKSANQSAAASQSIQERVEQMRTANWLQITDASYLQTNLMASPTASARSLPECTETITASAYPTPVSGVSTSTKLTRSNNQVTLNSTDATLKTQAMVKAEWTLTWKPSSGQALRSKSGTVLVAKGGIVK